MFLNQSRIYSRLFKFQGRSHRIVVPRLQWESWWTAGNVILIYCVEVTVVTSCSFNIPVQNQSLLDSSLWSECPVWMFSSGVSAGSSHHENQGCRLRAPNPSSHLFADLWDSFVYSHPLPRSFCPVAKGRRLSMSWSHMCSIVNTYWVLCGNIREWTSSKIGSPDMGRKSTRDVKVKFSTVLLKLKAFSQSGLCGTKAFLSCCGSRPVPSWTSPLQLVISDHPEDLSHGPSLPVTESALPLSSHRHLWETDTPG